MASSSHRGAIPPEASPSVALVRQALRERAVKQQELAQRTGLSKDHISRILLGKVAFPRSRDTLHAIAEVLGLDPLQFPEYRHQLQVLPESTRRLTAHLKTRGITQNDWIQRIVPAYSEGHLQLILRGGSPFPKDPATIELFAKAADADPYLFTEYLPLAEWRPRLLGAAEIALDAADFGVFKHLLGKIARQMAQRDAEEVTFDERVIKRFLARHFGDAPPDSDPELDDALSLLPPLAAYQPAVCTLLAALHESGLAVGVWALQAGVDPDTVFAIANGQMKLKPGAVADRLFQALGLSPPTWA